VCVFQSYKCMVLDRLLSLRFWFLLCNTGVELIILQHCYKVGTMNWHMTHKVLNKLSLSMLL
jgi:hypothetical protein